MNDEKGAPTDNSGRTDTTDQQHASAGPVLAERRFSDNALTRFSHDQNYNQYNQQFEKRTGTPEYGGPFGIISEQTPLLEPPPYISECPGAVELPSVEQGFTSTPFLPPLEGRWHPYHTNAGHSPSSPFPDFIESDRHLQRNLTGSWKDSQVPYSKLADDPQRSDSGGDDRHQERPLDDDRRAEPPVYSAEHLPTQPPPPPAIPYVSYWGQPGQPVPGAGPYD